MNDPATDPPNAAWRRMLRFFPLQIFLIALALRLVPVLLTRHLSIGLDDMFQYDMLARSLASGNGFRWYAPADLGRIAPYLHIDLSKLSLDPRGMLTTFRAPLYPALLSLIYLMSGINDGRFFAARLVQAFLGASLAPLTYFVAMRVLVGEERGKRKEGTSDENHEPRTVVGARADGCGEQAQRVRIARMAAWTVALYPMLIIFPLALATENLFFVLVLASVLILLELARARDGRAAIGLAAASGFLLGLAALTRSVILPFAGLAVMWAWLSLRNFKCAIAMGLTLMLTVAPWIVRNTLVAGQLTGIETSMGYNLYVGYYPTSTGSFTFGPSLDLLSILDDKARDEIGTQKALQFIRADPGRFPYLAMRRLGYFFDLELRAFTYFYTNNFLGNIPTPILVAILLILAVPFVIVSLSAAFGAGLLEKGPESLLLWLLFLGYLLPHVFILSEERFHLTLIPEFAVLAAGFWSMGPRAVQGRGKLILGLAALAAALLFVNWGFELARQSAVLTQMVGAGGNQMYLPY